ncbi:hypothetical protein Ddye_028628 [Dipteronia dyeriana]|uniref:Uncharacterized protein n=1 Tax=Dipteronia dyeriana TaxID=168575 RepID=A0AAD9TD98_9ROSI|nr:hypothetical protein Ddye_028628 [Dipteronia dyeriana]
MASDSEVDAIVEEQARGRGEQCPHTKRNKSKGPSMDALESHVDAHDEILSEMQATLSTVVDRPFLTSLFNVTWVKHRLMCRKSKQLLQARHMRLHQKEPRNG